MSTRLRHGFSRTLVILGLAVALSAVCVALGHVLGLPTAWAILLDVGVAIAQVVVLVSVWWFVLRPILSEVVAEQRRLVVAQGVHHAEADRQRFRRQYTDALEMAENEADLLETISRSFVHLPVTTPVEILLADSSQTQLHRAVVHTEVGGPGCDVLGPQGCAAIRRGRPSVFPDSEAMDACPRLRGRSWPCAAVCVPMVFMGETLGVAHASFDLGSEIPEGFVERLSTIAEGTAARLSALRAFRQVQLQATTDPLTGALNRRALERGVDQLIARGEDFAVIIADIDNFKRLNDRLGHDAGDRGIVTFAQAMQEIAGEADLVARFGGEEFIMVLAGATAQEAGLVAESLRRHLARIVAGTDTPTFTASYGVADTRVGHHLPTLVRVADAALLRAKETGKDRVVVADMGNATQRSEDDHLVLDQSLLASILTDSAEDDAA